METLILTCCSWETWTNIRYFRHWPIFLVSFYHSLILESRHLLDKQIFNICFAWKFLQLCTPMSYGVNSQKPQTTRAQIQAVGNQFLELLSILDHREKQDMILFKGTCWICYDYDDKHTQTLDWLPLSPGFILHFWDLSRVQMQHRDRCSIHWGPMLTWKRLTCYKYLIPILVYQRCKVTNFEYDTVN